MRSIPERSVTVLLVVFVALTATAGAGAAQAPLKKKVLPVLSSTDDVGKLTPCGCHTPKGGFARIASLVDSTKIKYGDALVVEAGDFAGDASLPHEAERLPFQMNMFQTIGYDAIGVGERELGFGVDTFRTLAQKSKVPVTSANLIDRKTGKPAFEPYVIVKKGNLKVGVFSVIGMNIELPADAAERLRVDDPVIAALRTVDELRKQCDVVVMLAHVGRADGEDMAAEVPGIDVVILSHHPGIVAQGRRVNGAITVASGEQIENMGYTLVSFDAAGKVSDLSSEAKVLLPEVGERGDIARLVKNFEDARNEQFKKDVQDKAVKS
jgi:2',3'-cyclic-nucleotide 2'-phosphodiesterase (5'-nucleotidase family)